MTPRTTRFRRHRPSSSRAAAPEPLPPSTPLREVRSPAPAVPTVLALLLAAVAVLAQPAKGAAQDEPDVSWADFDVTLDLREDGSFRVVERQVIVFRSFFDSAFAEIPLARIDDVRNVVVREETEDGVVTYREDRTDRYGEPDAGTYRWTVSAGTVDVEWGFEPAVWEGRTFLLEYDAVGALRVYPNPPPPADPNQQIWWTAIAPETTEVAPVDAASLTVRLPHAIDPAVAVVAQNDEVGDPAAHTRDGQTWTWRASDLEAGEEFTARLQFPPLVEAAPPAWQPAEDVRIAREEAAAIAAAERRDLVNLMLFSAGGLGIVAGGVGLYGLWYARGRDPHAGLVAEFLPTPPDDLPPGAAGVLVDEVAHQRDVVATLVDLARRGVIAMQDVRGGFGTDAVVTLLQADAPLVGFERELLNGLFGFNPAPNAAVRLLDISSRFAAATPGIRSRLYQELVDRGYFTASPEETRDAWRDRALKAFLVLVIGGAVAGVLFFPDLGWYWFPLGVAALLAVVVYLLSGALPRKTAAGAEAAARWRAFRRYLEEIERYEKVDEATERFERYLPYAVAFGLEERWVDAFARTDAAAPGWYGAGSDGAGADQESSVADWLRRRDAERRGTAFAGRTWWDVADGWGGGDWGGRGDGGDQGTDRGGGRGWSLPDWQGTSDHAGRTLQGVSNGLTSMLTGAGDALSAFGEAMSSGDDGGGSSGSSSWRSSRSGSSGSGSSGFGGGGRSGGSSGGGRRGFG